MSDSQGNQGKPGALPPGKGARIERPKVEVPEQLKNSDLDLDAMVDAFFENALSQPAGPPSGAAQSAETPLVPPSATEEVKAAAHQHQPEITRAKPAAPPSRAPGATTRGAPVAGPASIAQGGGATVATKPSAASPTGAKAPPLPPTAARRAGGAMAGASANAIPQARPNAPVAKPGARPASSLPPSVGPRTGPASRPSPRSAAPLAPSAAAKPAPEGASLPNASVPRPLAGPSRPPASAAGRPPLERKVGHVPASPGIAAAPSHAAGQTAGAAGTGAKGVPAIRDLRSKFAAAQAQLPRPASLATRTAPEPPAPTGRAVAPVQQAAVGRAATPGVAPIPKDLTGGRPTAQKAPGLAPSASLSPAASTDASAGPPVAREMPGSKGGTETVATSLDAEPRASRPSLPSPAEDARLAESVLPSPKDQPGLLEQFIDEEHPTVQRDGRISGVTREAAAPAPAADRPPRAAVPRVGGAAPAERSTEPPETGESEFDADIPTVSRAPEAPRVSSVPVPSRHSMRPPAELGSIAELPNLDAPHTRAEWLEQQALAQSDSKARARGLTIASELWAIMGEAERARASAKMAVETNPQLPIAQRQSRWLAAAAEDWEAVCSALDTELKFATSPEIRCHAANLASCILEAKLNDQVRARSRTELGLRARKDDVRAHISAIVDQLAAGANPPTVTIPDEPKLRELGQGLAFLAHLRGGAPLENDQTPVVVLETLGRHVATGHHEEAASAALLLARVPGLEPAATWLAASLLAQSEATAVRALELLHKLQASTPSRSVLRATLALAWELGDPSCCEKLLDPETKEAFSLAERLSYALLDATRTAVLTDIAAEATASAGLEPLVATARDVLSKGISSSPLASELASKRIALGRAIATGAISGTEPLALADGLPDDPGAVALCLERGAAGADPTLCAAALKRWPEDDDRLPPLARLLGEGLLFELAGNPENARQPYDAALALEQLHEGAARALAACPASRPLQELLESLADVVGDDERSALLLTEAARRRGPMDDAYDTLLTRATEIAPQLPFAYRAAEHAARARSDGPTLVAWLQRRRESVADPMLKALDSVREALLVAPQDPQHALSLLDEATRAHPNDIALRELHERVSTADNGIERFAWREQVAAEMPKSERTWMLLGLARECSTAGDLERAASLTEAVLAFDDSPFHQRIADRLKPPTATVSKHLERLSEPLTGEESREVQNSRLEQLLDLANDDPTHRGIRAGLEALVPLIPDNLPLLRWAEHTGLGHFMPDELEALAIRVARQTTGGESEAHWRLALRMSQVAGNFEHSREVFEKLRPHSAGFGDWFANARLQFALPSASPDEQLAALQAPLQAATAPLDLAVLTSVAAQASLTMGDPTAALGYVDQAVSAIPLAPSALGLRAEILGRLNRTQEAAETFELYAEVTGTDKNRVESLRRAGLFWIDRLGNLERGTAALDRALELQPDNEALFDQLRRIYASGGGHDKLVTLIERRIAIADLPESRSNLELMRARALMELGQTPGAKDAVLMALSETPDSEQALELLASLCQNEQDFRGERDALERLLGLRSMPEEQAALQRRLGQLYSAHLDDVEAARSAFEAALQVLPTDYEAGTGLAKLLARSGPPEPALELLTRLIEGAEASESKRNLTLALAGLQSQLLSDQRVSERTFEKARRTWPGDPAVLVAYAEFLQARGDQTALSVLLDRATNEARRALGTGRFQPQFFESLEAVARLRGDEASRLIIASTLAALRSEELTLEGAGASALDDAYDDFLAPEGLALPLRALLRRAGHIIEAAYPYDLAAAHAVELDPESQEWEAQLEAVAASVDVAGLRVLRSDRLETVCLATSSNPPTVVFGSALLASSDVRSRDFLFARAVKILQARACALANASPLELWPMIAAFLAALAPKWSPSGLDPQALAAARSAMVSRLDPGLRGELEPLAHEVAATIGNRASQTGPLVNQWAARAALLAIGSPAAALRGIACAVGQAPAPPTDPAERLKWVIRHAEARDLMAFSASEAYSLARRRLGLVEVSGNR